MASHCLWHVTEARASSTLDVALASERVANGGAASPGEVSSLQPDRNMVLVYGGFSGNGIDGWILSIHPGTAPCMYPGNGSFGLSFLPRDARYHCWRTGL